MAGQLKVGVNRLSRKEQLLVGEGTRESTAGAALVNNLQVGQTYHPILQVPPKPGGAKWTKAELDKWVRFAWYQSERRGPSLLSFQLQCPS